MPFQARRAITDRFGPRSGPCRDPGLPRLPAGGQARRQPTPPLRPKAAVPSPCTRPLVGRPAASLTAARRRRPGTRARSGWTGAAMRAHARELSRGAEARWLPPSGPPGRPGSCRSPVARPHRHLPTWAEAVDGIDPTLREPQRLAGRLTRTTTATVRGVNRAIVSLTLFLSRLGPARPAAPSKPRRLPGDLQRGEGGQPVCA